MTDNEKRLLQAIKNLNGTSDFEILRLWIMDTRNDYLACWKMAREKLEHFQGRYAAIDDLLIYMAKAEDVLRAVKKQEAENAG